LPAFTELNAKCTINAKEIRTTNVDATSTVISNLILDDTTQAGNYMIYDPSLPNSGVVDLTFYIWIEIEGGRT
jgi:hypothetical protein